MTLRDQERILDRALELPNAVWRLQSVTSATAPCVLLAFRYSALSDEKREGVMWLGFNETTGSALGDVLPRLRASMDDGAPMAPDTSMRAAHESNPERLISRIRVQLEGGIRRELDPFLLAMRRRLERDRARIYAYHNDLRREAYKRLLQGNASDKGRDASTLERGQAPHCGNGAGMPRQARRPEAQLRAQGFCDRGSGNYSPCSGRTLQRSRQETKEGKADCPGLACARARDGASACRFRRQHGDRASGLRRGCPPNGARSAGPL